MDVYYVRGAYDLELIKLSAIDMEDYKGLPLPTSYLRPSDFRFNGFKDFNFKISAE